MKAIAIKAGNVVIYMKKMRIIEPLEDGDLFRFHESPNPECPVGRNIHSLLDDKLKNIQEAMESEMKKYTLNDLRSGMQELLAKEA